MGRQRERAPLLLRSGGPFVIGRWRAGVAPGPVAVSLDGSVQAVLPAKAAWAWEPPAPAFGRLLDVVDPAGGASLIGGPVPFARWRAAQWDGWSREGDSISLAFRVCGPAAPTAAVPVELWGPDGRYAAGFADGEGVRRARLRIGRLPPGGAGVTLRPRIGAMLLDVAIEVPAEAFAAIGHVEAGEPWRVSGWAVQRGGGLAEVAVYLDGKLRGTVRAEARRPDVAALHGVLRSGFAWAFPAGIGLDGPVLVDVRAGVDGPSLAGSPYVRAGFAVVGHFDGIEGIYATGWAHAPGLPLAVEAVCEGEVIGRAVADLPRGDLVEAGLPTAACGFKIALGWPTARLIGRAVVVRVAGGGPALAGSPRLVAENPNLRAFLARGRDLPPATMTRLRRMMAHRTRATLVSIVMPVWETRREWLAEAIASVRAQWSPHWELICVDDGSRAAHVAPLLAAHARQDARVRVIRRARNGGIARAVNDGIAAARGDWVTVLDHDDALEPDAVYHLARTAQESGAELIYGDEVLTGEALDQVLALRARPAWSHDYYLSHPYFVHPVAVPTALARALGGWDARLAISADVDFVLRAAERARAIAHIPRPLYRWRTVPGSAGHRARAAVAPTMRRVVGAHLRRLGLPARAVPDGENQMRLDWPDPGGEVLVVVPTRDRADLLGACLASLARTADRSDYRVVVIDHGSREAATAALLAGLDGRHAVRREGGRFNYARLNNRAVAAEGGAARFVLFLNNDVEAMAPGWLARLRSLAARPEVGAVGPLLLYGNRLVQHAGAIVGFGGAAEHAMKHVRAEAPDGSRLPGVNANLLAVRDVSAVTAACLMMRLDVFRALGGFDERFAVGFNDTDLCLRARTAGLRVLYDGRTALLHHESQTRAGARAMLHPDDDALLRERWAGFLAAGDPFYSPLLSQAGTDHQVRADAGWKGRLGPRVMRT